MQTTGLHFLCPKLLLEGVCLLLALIGLHRPTAPPMPAHGRQPVQEPGQECL